MNKDIKIVTFGGVTQDIMFYTDEAVLIKNKKDPLRQELIAFEYGAKIRGDKVKFTFGGGAGNTAVSFAKLGLKVGVVTRLGGDRIGDDYLNNFKINKINTSLIQKDKTMGSGFSFIINYGDYNEHVIFSYRGADDNLKIEIKNLKNLKNSWFYMAALSGKYFKNNIENIFKVVLARKIKIAWNPGKAELGQGYHYLKKYLAKTDVLIVNYDEAIELALSAKKKSEKIRKLITIIYNFGPKIVAISHGHWGAYLFDGKNFYYEKALPITGINTTGAGDAFGSSLVAGLILFKNDLKKALQLAIIRSNYVIRKIGAQTGLLNKNESLKLMKKYGYK